MHSFLTKSTVKTSDRHETNIIITAVRTTNDVNGNGRYHVQVWIDRTNENYGNLWTPKVKGYRLTKNNQYIVHSSYIPTDLIYFIMAFEKAVEA